MGVFEQLGFQAAEQDRAMIATIPFGDWDVQSLISYHNPWGSLVHALAAETAVNSAIGYDDGAGGQTTKGGWMMYQITAVEGTGNVTTKIQDAATNTNPSFADLSGATSGAIANTAVPASGVVALAITATVRQFLRWQIVLSGITSVTFALAFVRETRNI